jgi:hypothetical protein
MLVTSVLEDHLVSSQGYDPAESGPAAVARAIGYWGNPPISPASRACLEQWAASCLPPTSDQEEAAQVRAVRQNALRQLVAASPDFQVS